MNSNAETTGPLAPKSLKGIRLLKELISIFSGIPDSLIALLGRFSIATVFWQSGQTKIKGLVIDFVNGEFQFAWPALSDSAIELFRSEYRLPLISPELAAPLAALAEHIFPLLILFGLATRFSALVLLFMTLVIQIFVYPDAYPTHGVWATVLLYLMAKGPGKLSLDYGFARRFCVR